MADMTEYRCLKCGEKWERPADKDPVGQCPNKECHSPDYDRPKRGETLKVCPGCGKEFPGHTNGHGVPGPCSTACEQRLRRRRGRRVGVGI